VGSLNETGFFAIQVIKLEREFPSKGCFPESKKYVIMPIDLKNNKSKMKYFWEKQNTFLILSPKNNLFWQEKGHNFSAFCFPFKKGWIFLLIFVVLFDPKSSVLNGKIASIFHYNAMSC